MHAMMSLGMLNNVVLAMTLELMSGMSHHMFVFYLYIGTGAAKTMSADNLQKKQLY
jgi:hypothetical protein